MNGASGRSRLARRIATGLLAANALALLACVFVPPPPLPWEGQTAAAAAGGSAATTSTDGSAAPTSAGDDLAPTSAGSGGGEDGEGSLEGMAELDFSAMVGERAPAGMSPASIHAYNKAQGDPIDGDFALSAALEGLTGKGALWADIETTRGTMTCELLEARAPLTVANFVGLARGMRPFLDAKKKEWVKRPFYDGLMFHRVDPAFMIQGGDPTGTGSGGPGFVLRDEHHPKLTHDRPGVLSMANRGPGTTGSQFFVLLGPQPHLDGKHNIFGLCTEDAVDVAEDIALVVRDADDRPVDPDTIVRIKIYRK